MTPPLAVDIDGTMSRPDRSIDPRALDALSAWDAPVVIATGKALPYPVALAQYAGVEEIVIAENGGIAVAEDALQVHGDRAAADAVTEEYRARGHDLGWGEPDLANMWRETEVAVSRESPLEPLVEIAQAHGLEVLDSEFAYHVKATDVSKGAALEALAAHYEVDPATFVAVGDSANDVSLFEVVGRSFAVGNAVDVARDAADEVMDGTYADGFLQALNEVISAGG